MLLRALVLARSRASRPSAQPCHAGGHHRLGRAIGNARCTRCARGGLEHEQLAVLVHASRVLIAGGPSYAMTLAVARSIFGGE